MTAPATTRVLTGITTTGTPHLGNYVGSIRAAVRASLRPGVQSFYFLADYHALIKCDDPARIQRSTLEIAASWLAAGLDPERVTFYRQSDIPEIPELTWLLTCVTGKGLLNRAHAYKAMLDRNAAAGVDADSDVTAGLFMYPVLMAADILMFKAHQVPVGRDQIQHIEMARDIAASFNHLYGEHLTLPEALVDDNVALLPGLDGRKMSKSYDNTIALFGPREAMRRQIMGIVTNSRAPGEAKDTEGSALYAIYRAFADDDEAAAFARAFADGIAWGDAKQQLLERIEREIGPMRERYEHLIAHPEEVEAVLQAGARKARALATPLMQTLRQAVGLRALGARQAASTGKPHATRPALPTFKQYREQDGLFYFKMVDAQGTVLLQSKGYASPREAGQAVKQLKTEGASTSPMTGKFELLKSKNGKYHFNLLASNGQVILTSEMYESKASAMNGIESVKKNGGADAHYERLTGKDGSPYFTLKAINDQVIGQSQMYSSTATRDSGIVSCISNASSATIKDLTGS